MAKFLEGRGEVAKALEVAKDPEYRFELAVQLSDFDVAVAIAEELASPARWKQLGELALSDGRLPLAQRCLAQSDDLSGMMLMFTATGNRAGMRVRLLLRAALCRAVTRTALHRRTRHPSDSTHEVSCEPSMCMMPMHLVHMVPQRSDVCDSGGAQAKIGGGSVPVTGVCRAAPGAWVSG